jgi:hypothetical protein
MTPGSPRRSGIWRGCSLGHTPSSFSQRSDRNAARSSALKIGRLLPGRKVPALGDAGCKWIRLGIGPLRPAPRRIAYSSSGKALIGHREW